VNAGANAAVYSAADGSTTFTDNLNVGDGSGAAGNVMNITGGTLTTGAANGAGYDFFNDIGYGTNTSGVLNISGGTLNANGVNTTFDNIGLDIGFGTGASGALNVSGGTVNVQGALEIDNGSLITLTGGLINVMSISGTAANTFDGAGFSSGGPITFGAGNGVFEESASSTLTGVTINFLSGSAGELSLLGETATGFDALIASGAIEKNGVADMNTADFTTTTSGGQGILELAATTAPEPSTWVMLMGGFALLLGVQRLGRQRSV
jgi:hypothetical protein